MEAELLQRGALHLRVVIKHEHRLFRERAFVLQHDQVLLEHEAHALHEERLLVVEHGGVERLVVHDLADGQAGGRAEERQQRLRLLAQRRVLRQRLRHRVLPAHVVVERVGGAHEAEVVHALRGALRDLAEVDVVDQRDAVQRRRRELRVLRLTRRSRRHRLDRLAAPDGGRDHLALRLLLLRLLLPLGLLLLAGHLPLVPRVVLAAPVLRQVVPVDVPRAPPHLPAPLAHDLLRLHPA